ncbi:hypothetical protein CEUSTIGMA_g6141.t1 [Chlamydomonas eustigma]|uniref:Uncharacterized protein n=1 Tax=Chlamydomonas eustigma TaxID=1157962 RepID=A0A250X6J6_9CHLO|nr:hypothetical protein CEUSTIGMA_g6141.t1 [Chlamydomonas eustigma]|eukprot:GAX78703.1 hypothetical protein CEUSTIGMA_g6141.t1 [Chlamydomonas eustigma]
MRLTSPPHQTSSLSMSQATAEKRWIIPTYYLQGRPNPERISDLNVDIDAANKAVSNALAGILSSSLPPSSSKAPSRSSLDVQPTASLSKAEPLLHRHRQVVNRSHSGAAELFTKPLAEWLCKANGLGSFLPGVAYQCVTHM